MDRRVVRFFAPALTLLALMALALAAACGGGDDETPEPTATSETEATATATQEATATATEAVATATQTAASPTEAAGDDEPNQTPVPEGADNFQVTVGEESDAVTYEGAYDDGFPICIEGGPSAVNVVFYGDDRAGSGKFIQLTLIADPETPDQLVLELSISGDDNSQNDYNISTISTPPQGSGTVTAEEQEGVTTVNVTGTTGDGTPLELVVECHPAAAS